MNFLQSSLCPPTGPAWDWHSAILEAFCPEPAASPGEDTYVIRKKQEKLASDLNFEPFLSLSYVVFLSFYRLRWIHMGMIAMHHRMP